MLGEPAAAAGLRTLDRLGVLAVLLPESLPMRATAQPLPHHFDVWEHSLRAVEGDRCACSPALDALDARGARRCASISAQDLGGGLTRREALKLAALLHDVAKPETRAEVGGRVRFIGHDTAGARRTGEIAQRLRLSRHAAQVLERLVRRAPAARCIWRRRASSPGARASASSGRSVTRRAICCCWPWPTRPRSTALLRWRSGRGAGRRGGAHPHGGRRRGGGRGRRARRCCAART